MHYPFFLPVRITILRYLWLLFSSLALLNEGTTQAQIIPNGAGTVVNTQGNQINIHGGTQSGVNLFHSFGDFNVNSAQVANFLSNPQTQNILGRINGGNPSFINGLLQVTGGNSNLFLMNPAGIVFGQGASLNIPASFTATTANQIGFGNNLFNAFGDNDFSALVENPDSFIFNTTQAGSIVNAGDLVVGSGQNLSLIAGNTINTGRLSTPGGEIQVLAVPGTNRVRLSQPGQVLSLEIVLPDSNELKAVDLPTLLTGSDLPGIAVNPSGQVEVAGTSLPNQQGLAVASGSIDVSNSTGIGGTVQIMGDRVAALNSRINANGATGGGTVRLGGEYLGGRDTGIAPEFRFNSQRTLVDGNSLIRANATVTGEGGRVIIWADHNTGYFGRITGRGATGRGGFVEVSGKENLAFDGRVELQGLNGLGGSLLLDPANIFIVPGGSAINDGDISPDGVINEGDGAGQDWFISAGALASIPAGTAINITAGNNIDFQTTVNLITNGTAPITFNAPTITASAGGVILRTRGRNVTLTASNSINAQNLSVNTEDGSILPGTIQATAGTGNLRLGSLVSASNAAANGQTITLNAPQGLIVVNNVISSSFSGNAGAINITAQGNITTNNLSSSSTGGNGAAIILNSSQGTITANDVNSSSRNGNGGAIDFTSQGNITTALINSLSLFSSAGSVSLNATQGGITANSIESTSGAGNGGAVNITARNLVRVTGFGFSSCNVDVSICSNSGGGTSGVINIRHGGSTTTPFTVGNATINGTAGKIDAGAGSIINTTTTIPVPPYLYTQGIVQIITTAPLPPVVPPVASPISPELFTLLRNPAPPATPAPVVVGTPDIPVVESPIPTPIVLPVVVVPPVVTPEIVPATVLPPAIVPQPTLIPAPNPTSALPVILEAIDPQDITPEPESPRGNLVFITNPSSTEIASRLELLELGTRARLRLFEPVVPNTLPPSQTPDYQYNLSAIQNNLNQANQTTGLKSALIYVFFVPHSSGIKDKDTLEVIMINSSGEPLRVQLLDVTRRQVLAVANRLQNSSIYLPRPDNLNNTRQDDRNTEFMVINPIGEAETVRLVTLSNSTTLRTRLTTSSGVDDLKDDPRFDLNAAQQVYQWLLAPLESDLQQQGINNLVFVLDQELRNIPLEAIHDGQGLIRERYSIAKTE